MKIYLTQIARTGLTFSLILFTTCAFAQKSTKEGVLFQYLSLPQNNWSSAKDYSITMNGKQLPTLDAILKQCSNEELKNFSIPNKELLDKGAIEAYFKLLNIPQVAKDGELSIALEQGESKLLTKKETINKVSQKVNGERVIKEYKYYAFTFNQPCRLRITHKGKTLFNDNIGNTKRTENFGQNSTFTTTAELESQNLSPDKYAIEKEQYMGFAELYRNPLLCFLFTLIEPLPVGFILAPIAAIVQLQENKKKA